MKSSIIIFVWLFVFLITAVPFLIFFEEDQTEWYKENDIEIGDWDKKFQKNFRAFLHIAL